VERQLVDQLAMLQTALFRWQQILIGRTMLDTSAIVQADQGKGRYQPPRVTDYEATEQAGRMVERFHRLLLRTVRALQDLRRPVPPVVVRRAAQVNIGQQQVNVALNRDDHGLASGRLAEASGMPAQRLQTPPSASSSGSLPEVGAPPAATGVE
jgi:hypothetical protein